MEKKSNTSLYLIGGVALVVIFLLMSKSSTTVKSTSISGTGGILSGLGNLASGLGKGISSIWSGGSSNPPADGDYVPNVARGEDSADTGN